MPSMWKRITPGMLERRHILRREERWGLISAEGGWLGEEERDVVERRVVLVLGVANLAEEGGSLVVVWGRRRMEVVLAGMGGAVAPV